MQTAIKNIVTGNAILPVILLTMFITTLLIRGLCLTDGFIVLQETRIYETLFGSLTFIPAILMLFLKQTKGFSWQRKMLLVGLTFLMVNLLMSDKAFRNNSFVFYLLAFIYFIAEKRKFERPNALFWLIIVYFIWNAVSLFWVVDLKIGATKLLDYLPYLAFPLFFSMFSFSKKEMNLLMMILFRTTLAFMFVALCFWLMASRYVNVPFYEWFVSEKTFYGDHTSYDLIYSWNSFRHPTYLSLIYFFALGVGFYYSHKKSEIRPSSVELALFSAASFILTLITQSRIGIVWLVLLLFFAFVWLLRNHRKILLSLGVVTIVLAIILGSIFSLKINGIYNLDTRLQMYETAIYSIKQKPLLGCGIGGMPAILHSQQIAEQLGYETPTDERNKHPHNQFLGDFFQTGIVGFLLLVAMLSYIIIFSYKTKKWLLLYFFMLFLCAMMIEMPLNYDKGIALFATMCCLLGRKTK